MDLYTDIKEQYVIKNNKKLRYGYTTGTCAAAASKAALEMLFEQRTLSYVSIHVPKGYHLLLEVNAIKRDRNTVSCAIEKDGGDDPDVTSGAYIYAQVTLCDVAGIHIDGGIGVGRVTKKGLQQKVGEAAINIVPKEMITKNLQEVCKKHSYVGGVKVLVFVPNGEELAKKTLNSMLGIVGGISILGTSGIVEPMSEKALIDCIEVEMKMHKENNVDILFITPGNYGQRYAKERFQLENPLKCSNYIGETIDFACCHKISKILFIAHIGKFIKVAGGMMNTHSAYGDARMEILAANAIRNGGGIQLAQHILSCVTTEEAVQYINENEYAPMIYDCIIERILYYLNRRSKAAIEFQVVLFSNQYGELAHSEHAYAWIESIKAQKEAI